MKKKTEVATTEEVIAEPTPQNPFVKQYRELEWQRQDFMRLLDEGLATAEVPWQGLVQVQTQITMLDKLREKAYRLVPDELKEEALKQ